jgi:hypothetical protein
MHAIKGLTGRWNGELDSFYVNLGQRVENYRSNPPPTGWDGTYVKSDNK